MTTDQNEGASARALDTSFFSLAQIAVALSLAGFSLYTALFGVMSDMIQRSVHLGFVLLMVFLSAFVVTRIAPARGTVERIIARIGAIVGVIVMFYHVFYFDEIASRFGELTQLEFYFGIAATIVLLEATRRAIDLPIVILAVTFLLYAYFGDVLPGIAGHRGYDAERIISQLYLGGGGIFGTPLGVSATFIVLIVLFGAILEHSGAGHVLMDIAS